ncbi:MAG: hypothetical protein V4628_00185 [Pseudomonadota bacterium]
MIKNKYGIGMWVAITFLAACAHAPEEQTDPSNQIVERELPSWVYGVGFNSWSVRCPLQTVVINDFRMLSSLYKSNGNEKTFDEFCANYNAGSRIYRR